MYYLYILLNEAKTRTYTGVATDVDKRLKEHNAGRVVSSRPYRPYILIHSETFTTLKEARAREKFYKSSAGRRKLKKMFLGKTGGKSLEAPPERGSANLGGLRI